jgi:hypothetical protein
VWDLLFLAVKNALEEGFALMVIIPARLFLVFFHPFAHFLGLDPLVVIGDLFLFRPLIAAVCLPLLFVFLALLALTFERLVLFWGIAATAGVLGRERRVDCKNEQQCKAYFIKGFQWLRDYDILKTSTPNFRKKSTPSSEAIFLYSA